MPENLGLLEIECDAPSYSIVRACRKLGMTEPEDVRWCRKSRQARRHHGWIQFLASPIWGRLLGRHDLESPTCVCGEPLPIMECYTFTFENGEQIDYQMGQCPHCRTIYWEKM